MDPWTCEKIFWELLPSLRRYIATVLRQQGKTVPEIAKTLGVTKSAVSQYLKGKRGGELDDWMKEVVARHVKDGCIDLVAIINEIVHDPRFKGWKCG